MHRRAVWRVHTLGLGRETRTGPFWSDQVDAFSATGGHGGNCCDRTRYGDSGQEWGAQRKHTELLLASDHGVPPILTDELQRLVGDFPKAQRKRKAAVIIDGS